MLKLSWYYLQNSPISAIIVVKEITNDLDSAHHFPHWNFRAVGRRPKKQRPLPAIGGLGGAVRGS